MRRTRKMSACRGRPIVTGLLSKRRERPKRTVGGISAVSILLLMWSNDEVSMIVHIGRRTFLGAIGGAAVTWPVAVRFQVAATERRSIGWLSGSASKMGKFFADDFLDG